MSKPTRENLLAAAQVYATIYLAKITYASTLNFAQGRDDREDAAWEYLSKAGALTTEALKEEE